MTKIKLSPGLIPAIAKGDMDAFEQLYRQTYHVLYALALSWSGDHEVTLDLLQDTYIHIYNKSSTYTTDTNPMGWMIRICKNLYLNSLEKKKREPSSNYIDIDDCNIPLESIEDVDNRLLIEQLLTELTEEERTIVILHALAGLRFIDIAKDMGLPLNTVLSKYHRCMKKLAKSQKLIERRKSS